MRIKYKIKDILEYKQNGLTLNEVQYYERWNILPNHFHLTYEKEYVVYGIEYISNNVFNYFIVDDTEVSYPKTYPSTFFQIIDSRESSYWVENKKEKHPKFKSFDELVNNPYFFDDIIDSKNNMCNIFLEKKKKMDFEFENNLYPSVTNLGENLLMCYKCDYSWIEESKNELLQCPKCFSIQNK